jgi:hypothetical protein
MPTYVVERVFSPALTMEQFEAASAKLAPCVQERGITYLGSQLALDGSRCICMYEAPDAERIREAQNVGGAPFERVWPAKVIKP